MKSFFPTFFASCLGVFAAFALCIFILIGISISSISQKESYGDNTILKLKLEEFIPEKSDNVNQQSVFFGGSSETIGLRRILTLLEAASEDKKIKGILIENNSIGVGQATVLSLMAGLQKFKESGKFIYTYADSHSQSSYLLCSVADSMFINPQGGVDLKGYGAAIPFFKNMLDKVGIEMNIFYAGNFKSGTEPYRLNEMSDFNRLQTRTFLEDMQEIMIKKIAENRNLTPEKINNIMANLEGRTGKKALENGLVDALFYKDQLEDFLRQKLDIKEGKKLKMVSLSEYNTIADIDDKGKGKNKIAIIYAEGEIIYGSNEPGIISEKKYISMLTKIRNDKNIKAVVLRVNSPGGNAFTSDVIWRELEKIKEAGKPLIASFGDYAASGGYYIAAGADRIVAQPNTLTGSIGVYMMFPNATKLLNEKIGVNFDTIKTHEFATGFSPTNNLSEKEKALLQESTYEIYDLFIDRVSKGRKLSVDSTKVIAQGRVWTGKRAIEIGLVDELGGLDEAIAIAAEKAGLTDYKTVEYPFIEEDFIATIVREIQKGKGDEDVMGLFSTKEERMMLEQYQQFKAIIRLKEPNARLPFIFNFN
ncbi:MAG: signal peptide peptidase SppA [Saprospiraceae bacterium]|nr:signal peptide peptidase SppA [Saprospiraceae bacterium]MBP6569176.1 signal peptide peptidase SppA [Saprospiraceae bacterium]